MRPYSIAIAATLLAACETTPLLQGPSDPIEDTGIQDVDGDGYDETVDCNDFNRNIYPGAEEVCDNQDNDCNDLVDDNPVDGTLYYPDRDGDGYGEESAGAVTCSQPSGFVDAAGDCDDSNPLTHADAEEICDGEDNDCDEEFDEATDADNDGFDTVCGGDCNDEDPEVNPGADETCDGIDNNCIDGIDEPAALDAGTYYSDADADGFGDASTGQTSCEQPSGTVTDDSDCNDSSNAAYPGAIEVFDGLDNDCSGSTDRVTLDNAQAQFLGLSTSAQTGYSVSNSGDFNADGYDDLLLGATNESTVNGTKSGAAYVVYGPVSGSSSLTSASAAILGEAASDFAGRSVAACDVDGDGGDDILVGSWGSDELRAGAGAVMVYYSPLTSATPLPDAMLMGSTDYEAAGWSVACAGDVNGDGYSDVLVGAPKNSTQAADSGAVHLVLGPIVGNIDLFHDSEATIFGEDGSDLAGGSVAGIGDINQDGYDDIMVGSTYNKGNVGNGAGASYIILGPVSGYLNLQYADVKIAGTEVNGYARNISGVGDVDGDGNVDVLVGAHGADAGGTDRGRAYLFHGPLSGTIGLNAADSIISGNSNGDGLGLAVAGAGDVNSDGYMDILIGAPNADNGGSDSGASYLFYGPVSPGSLAASAADAVFSGEAAGDNSGWSLSGGGDVDGDGIDDFLIGARFESTGATDAGAVYLIEGHSN